MEPCGHRRYQLPTSSISSGLLCPFFYSSHPSPFRVVPALAVFWDSCRGFLSNSYLRHRSGRNWHVSSWDMPAVCRAWLCPHVTACRSGALPHATPQERGSAALRLIWSVDKDSWGCFSGRLCISFHRTTCWPLSRRFTSFTSISQPHWQPPPPTSLCFKMPDDFVSSYLPALVFVSSTSPFNFEDLNS